nr:MAG TPA: hypothetical protein [Herelleviridae sp.]
MRSSQYPTSNQCLTISLSKVLLPNNRYSALPQ